AFAEGLEGKVMCGYQGWFRTPDDGTNTGWFHYSGRKGFEPGSAGIDLWPDVREIPSADRTPTPFKHADGSTAEVYSSVKPSVINLHFKWMKEYGIDGVFLQRFVVTTKDPRHCKPMDAILETMRTAAKDTGRVWSVMYDLSGVKPGETKFLIADWKRLVDTYHFADAKENPAYLRHRGKPLVALWGLGFSDRAPMLDEWKQLIEFFKNDPQYGGVSLMLGVPCYWRTLTRDSITDPELHALMEKADVISPWTIGRFNSPKNAESHFEKTAVADFAWCKEKKLDYLPVAFPGFSWHNLQKGRGKEAPVNAIPRLGGEFLWSQIRQTKKLGAGMQYVAMFDELDEGTALFKTRQDPPVGDSPFAIEPGVPEDQYLWLTGQAGKLLRGEISDAMPVR
ncbi:MAG TPA: glycoside hydrolase family 71/99-like protein, partial [Verrucomicrobium sp.]|nr:glycoside hydrolase family 71/99-like protein [Verrucomicrobium sp.]